MTHPDLKNSRDISLLCISLLFFLLFPCASCCLYYILTWTTPAQKSFPLKISQTYLQWVCLTYSKSSDWFWSVVRHPPDSVHTWKSHYLELIVISYCLLYRTRCHSHVDSIPFFSPSLQRSDTNLARRRYENCKGLLCFMSSSRAPTSLRFSHASSTHLPTLSDQSPS